MAEKRPISGQLPSRYNGFTNLSRLDFVLFRQYQQLNRSLSWMRACQYILYPFQTRSENVISNYLLEGGVLKFIKSSGERLNKNQKWTFNWFMVNYSTRRQISFGEFVQQRRNRIVIVHLTDMHWYMVHQVMKIRNDFRIIYYRAQDVFEINNIVR